MDYLASFHSVLKYGITFWGNCTDTGNAFITHTKKKRIVRTMAGVRYRSSCTGLFKKFEI